MTRTVDIHKQRSVFDWAQWLGFGELERREGLPRGLLTAMCRQESFGDNTAHSAVGACGLLQLMPATAAAYGIDASDVHHSVAVAAHELGKSYRHFDGDLAKTLAAYNYGHGHLHATIRTHGHRRWREHLPYETRTYIAHIESDIAADRAIAGIHKDHHDAMPAELDALLLGNGAIRHKIEARLAGHHYDVKPGHCSDAQLHAAIKEFEGVMRKRGITSATETFRNDGLADFASLDMLLCRRPGVWQKLDKPQPNHGH